MKKKIISVLCTAIILVGCFMFAACSPNDAVKLEINGGIFTEYEVGETLNLENINVKVTLKDGQVLTMTAASSGVSVTGFDSTVANLNGKVTVSYQTVSVEVPYKVYSQAHFIYGASDLAKITNATSPDTLIIKTAGTYDLSNYVFNRNLTLIGRLGQNILLKDVSTNIAKTDAALNVSIKNCKITTDDAAYAVKFASKRIAGDMDTFALTNCEVIANGIDNGVIVPARCNMTMEGCVFNTPTTNDVFSNLFSGNSSTKDYAGTLEIKNCTFNCAFNYGLYNTVPTKFENNYVEGKLSSSSIFTSEGSGQKFFVAQKNPVWFHFNINADGLNANAAAKLDCSVKDNTFKGLESLVRIYNYDKIERTSQVEFTFEDNTFNDITVLLISSSSSYTGLSPLFNIITENNTNTTGYEIQTRAVIEKNTTIDFDLDDAANLSVTNTSNGAAVYFNLDTNTAVGIRYQAKNTTDAANSYIFVGTGALAENGAALGTGAGKRHVLRDDAGNFYVVIIEYSSDGKDLVKYYNGAGFYDEKSSAATFTLDQIKEMLAWPAD